MKKVLLLLASIIVFASCSNKKDDRTITIACNLPMTGVYAFNGESIYGGLKMAYDDWADSLSNHKINVIIDIQDNQSETKQAVNIYNKQSIKGSDIYVSGITQQTLAIIDRVEKDKIPHFIWSFDPLDLDEGGNIFRTWVNMSAEAECFIKYIEKLNPKSVACVYQNITSTQTQFTQNIIPALNSKNIKVFNNIYDVNMKDFKDFTAKLKSESPDVIILYGFKESLMNLIKNIHTLGLNKNVKILCSFDFLDVVDELDNELLNGIVTNVPQYIYDYNENSMWNKRFISLFNRKPRYTDAYAYDMGLILMNAIVNSFSHGTSLKDCMLNIKIDGVTGMLQFNKKQELEYNVVTCIYENGKLKQIE